LTCFKHIFSFYFKSSYIPHSITNFSDRVECEDGKYKAGALCYRDCKKIGLINCGIGACAGSSFECGSGIFTIAIDAIMAVAKAVLFIASFGTSSAGASQGLTAAVNSAK